MLSPVRLLILLVFLCCVQPLTADRLHDRLQLVLPGGDNESENDRRFVERMVRQLITELESDKIVGKPYHKQLAWIRQRLDGGYFHNYDLNADLGDLFNQQKYNDVTATIAYALLLEHFNIPHITIIDHWEAQLIADPNGRSIVLRSPMGQSNSNSRQLAFRQDYVALLNLTVLPAQRPVGQSAMDSLFRRFHYSPTQPLEFDQLAAYYHYQNGLLAYELGDYPTVIQSVNLARQLDDRPILAVLEQAAYLQLARIEEEEDATAALYYLFELWHKDPSNEYLPYALLSYYTEASEEAIEIGHGFEGAEQLYLYLHSRGRNFPSWQMQLKELYFFQRSRYEDKKKRDDLVMQYMDSLYRLRPSESFYQQALSSLNIRLIRAQGLEGVALSQRIDATVNRYPFMANEPVLSDLLLGDLAKKIRAHFVAAEPFAGEQLLVEMRRSLANMSESPQRSIWVLEAYLAASYYYFLQAQYDRSRALINEALSYAPTNDYLLHRQELLVNY